MEKIFNSSNHERLFKSRKSGFQNRLRVNDFGLKKAKVDLQDVVVSATFLGLKSRVARGNLTPTLPQIHT